jgi:hypothetical protein
LQLGHVHDVAGLRKVAADVELADLVARLQLGHVQVAVLVDFVVVVVERPVVERDIRNVPDVLELQVVDAVGLAVVVAVAEGLGPVLEKAKLCSRTGKA